MVSTDCSEIGPTPNGGSNPVRPRVVWQAMQMAFQWPSVVATPWPGGWSTTALRGTHRASSSR